MKNKVSICVLDAMPKCHIGTEAVTKQLIISSDYNRTTLVRRRLTCEMHNDE